MPESGNWFRHFFTMNNSGEMMKRNLNYLSLCLIASLLCCLSVTSCASNANGQSASRVLTVNKIERKEIPFSTENAIVVEAENGDCYGVKIDSQRENFSGSGYVSFPSYDQGILELPVSVPAAGDYCMFLHLELRYGAGRTGRFSGRGGVSRHLRCGCRSPGMAGAGRTAADCAVCRSSHH